MRETVLCETPASSAMSRIVTTGTTTRLPRAGGSPSRGGSLGTPTCIAGTQRGLRIVAPRCAHTFAVGPGVGGHPADSAGRRAAVEGLGSRSVTRPATLSTCRSRSRMRSRPARIRGDWESDRERAASCAGGSSSRIASSRADPAGRRHDRLCRRRGRTISAGAGSDSAVSRRRASSTSMSTAGAATMRWAHRRSRRHGPGAPAPWRDLVPADRGHAPLSVLARLRRSRPRLAAGGAGRRRPAARLQPRGPVFSAARKGAHDPAFLAVPAEVPGPRSSRSSRASG